MICIRKEFSQHAPGECVSLRAVGVSQKYGIFLRRQWTNIAAGGGIINCPGAQTRRKIVSFCGRLSGPFSTLSPREGTLTIKPSES
jgi:hypothetical protein